MADSKSVLADELLSQACLKLGFDPQLIFDQLKNDSSPNHQRTIIHHVFSLSEKPEEHTKIAGAIMMWHLYSNSPVTLREYLQLYRSYMRDDVIAFFEKHHDVLEATATKHFPQDFDLSYFSAGTLIDTYLARRSYEETPQEVPQFCWLRVAVGEFASSDSLEDVLRVYHRYATRECVPASPTIFNIGFKEGAPSSCMLYAVDDSMDDILHSFFETGMASKNNAGLGVDVSGLRHSNIGRHGMSKGIIPLMKILDDLTIYINQGGRRPGAMTVSTRVHHIDTPEFINLVDKVGEDKSKVTKINTSLMLSDLFMKRCLEGGDWTLFCPKQTGDLNLLHGAAFEKRYLEFEEKAKIWKLHQKNQVGPPPQRIDSRTYPADEIMDMICDMQIKSGMPYIVHGCNINRKNNMSNVGPVRSSNLCQEIMIPAVPREQTGSCNLASISLAAFVRDQKFDFNALGECVRDMVTCLNKVIDESKNVSEKVKKSNDLNRPIGIGVSGFADMCYALDLTPCDTQQVPLREEEDDFKYGGLQERPLYSEEALRARSLNPKLDELNYTIWSCMYYNALLQSTEEAKKAGPYPNFWTSPTAQGQLQYHLWQEEAKETGREYPQKLTPVEPSAWGQEGSWDELIQKIKTDGLRNALLLSCQPTASTAQIIGNCESTEFHMQNIYTRRVLSGDYPVLNFQMVSDLQKIGLWNTQTYNLIKNQNGSLLGLSEAGLSQEQISRLRYLKEKYLTMWEIPVRANVELASQRQVFIDHSQSFNVYIAHPTKDLLKALHMITWEYGNKTGIYYLRTRGENDPLKIGQATKVPKETKQLISAGVPTAVEEAPQVCIRGQEGCVSCQ